MRSTRRREAVRQESESEYVAEIFESAGDDAVQRYAYNDARRFYEVAISKAKSECGAQGRLAEKIAEATYCSYEPHAATPWFERALQYYETTSVDSKKACRIRLRLARQYWLSAHTLDTLPLIDSVIKTTSRSSVHSEVWLHSCVAMINYLVLLGRFDEARQRSWQIHKEAMTGPAATRIVFLSQQAILAASAGRKSKSFELFEQAVKEATAFSDGHLLTLVLDDHALWSTTLGDIETARRCWERALLVAHEQNILWRIAYLSLRYANVLMLAGEWDRARDLVMNAATHQLDTPGVRLLLLGTAFPLGVETNDRSLLRLSRDEQLVEVAFRSGEEVRIASAAAAFASFFLSQDQTAQAAALIARALPHVYHADHCWQMLIEAGRICTDTDTVRARALLEARTLLPCNSVAKACLDLFDAYRAQRRSDGAVESLASSASKRFSALGWSMYARHAEILISRTDASSIEQARAERQEHQERHLERRIGDLGTRLTPREHDIAELVLEGLTNRAIATRLHITENTVESHMSSILLRLGIRSRWQVKEALNEG